MNRNAVLPTLRLPPGTSIAQAEPWQTEPVTLDSPGLSVLTDLSRVKAATLHPAPRLAKHIAPHEGMGAKRRARDGSIHVRCWICA